MTSPVKLFPRPPALTPAWAARAVAYAGTPKPDRAAQGRFEPAAGLCWWTNFDGVWPSVPRNAFAGAGAGHEVLLVVPSLSLVVVRHGEAMEDNRANAASSAPSTATFSSR